MTPVYIVQIGYSAEWIFDKIEDAAALVKALRKGTEARTIYCYSEGSVYYSAEDGAELSIRELPLRKLFSNADHAKQYVAAREADRERRKAEEAAATEAEAA